MNVGLFTSVYFNNIGNGFIDLGAEETLKRAISEDDNIVKISQCANFAASMSKSFAIKENPLVNRLWVNLMQKHANKIHDKTYKTVNTLDVVSVPQMMKLDFLIIPGCVLTVPFFTIYGTLLKEKKRQGCEIVFLGASGNFYTEYEVEVVSQYLKELKPYAIMTRDSVAYQHYNKYAQMSYNGIDNVFFVNLLNLPSLETIPSNYVVVNIEEPKHKSIGQNIIESLKEEGQNIVFTNHKPYPYSKVSKMVKNGVIISDYPLDYLIVYKNALKVYSDRVHACIPTLSFGNYARLYSDSPRRLLFENVEIEKNNEEMMRVVNLIDLQEKQIEYLKNILK